MIELRTSERSAMKRCPQKWYWAYVEGLRPLRPKTPLWFGSAWHEAMAAWYLNGTNRGPHPAETFSASLEGDRSFLVGDEEDEKVYEDARELGVDMGEHYVEHYGRDESLFFIAVEQTFQVWLPAIDGRKRFIRYLGTFDGVYRDLATGEHWLMEHKTTAGLGIEHLQLDDQGGTYFAVASAKLRKMGVLKKNEEIAGVMYNYVRKQKRDLRPQNAQGLRTNKPLKAHYIEALAGVDNWTAEQLTKMKIDELEGIAAGNMIQVLGDVSQKQPAPYFDRWPIYRTQAERRTIIKQIQTEASFIEGWRDGTLPLFKTPVQIGAGACAHQCEFFRMCQLHQQGDAGWEEFRDTMFERQDPYADHRRDRKSSD